MAKLNKNPEVETEEVVPKFRIETESAVPVFIWIWGWMFSVGYAKLDFWDSMWALIVWPYYIGNQLSL